MKINAFDNKPVVTPLAERKNTAAPTSSPPESSAQVNLSAAATTVAGTAGDGSFDARKVDRIAQAIRDGQFKVHPEVIADKLIANATELLQRKSN
ncbi:MAG: flagellar biosynthesis anti-sigma factor FlgM [Pseudomonadota bacterium]|nr:flagellar biosynthesis anti-sigma factor FlgM [Pseudomonadota bacterium]